METKTKILEVDQAVGKNKTEKEEQEKMEEVHKLLLFLLAFL